MNQDQDFTATKNMMDALVESNASIFEKAAQYTNLVILAGYAGIFAVWNFTRDQLPAWIELISALMVTISIAVFVGFEIYKMVVGTVDVRDLMALHKRRLTPDQVVAALNKIHRNSTIRMARFMIVWRRVLITCVLFGFGGGLLLVCSFVWFLSASLFGDAPSIEQN